MEKIPEYKIKPEKVRIETSLTILKGQPHDMNGQVKAYKIISTQSEVCGGGVKICYWILCYGISEKTLSSSN